MGEDGEFRTENWKVQESASLRLSHRGLSARGRHRNQHDHTVTNGEDETIF